MSWVASDQLKLEQVRYLLVIFDGCCSALTVAKIFVDYFEFELVLLQRKNKKLKKMKLKKELRWFLAVAGFVLRGPVIEFRCGGF